MALSGRDRASFITLLPHLGPGMDRAAVVSFVRDHWVDCLEELTADPGFDQVRAGLVRVFPALLGERAAETLAVVDEVLSRLQAATPSAWAAHHPAWTGLCALELGLQLPHDSGDPLDRALRVASAGYRALGSPAPGGEVLWAMAEQAEEVGWTDRVDLLLEAAADAHFEDPGHGERVRLLLAQRHLDQERHDRARELLEEVVGSTRAPEEVRIHARWLLAVVCEHGGDRESAREWLREALREAAGSGEDEAAERLKSALGALDPE